MFALAAAIVWLLTMPAIGVFDDAENGLFLGLALLAAHLAIPLSGPWRR